MQWQLQHMQRQLAAVEKWAAGQRADNDARRREQAQRAMQHGQQQDTRIAALESHIVLLEYDLQSLTEEVRGVVCMYPHVQWCTNSMMSATIVVDCF